MVMTLSLVFVDQDLTQYIATNSLVTSVSGIPSGLHIKKHLHT